MRTFLPAKIFDEAQAGKDYSSRAHISEDEIQRRSTSIGEPLALFIRSYTGRLCQEVYLAFDEREYYHSEKRGEDPSEVYTRPMICRILEDQQTFHEG